MKIINIKSILTLEILLSVLFISCEKEKDNQDDEAPSIQILQPTEGKTYENGDTIFIQAEITDNDELHDVFAKIERTHNNITEEVWNLETHSHDELFSILGWYVIEVSGMHNVFELSVTATDHNGNKRIETYGFHVMQ